MIQKTLSALRQLAKQPIPMYLGDGAFHKLECTLRPGLAPERQKSLRDAWNYPLPQDYLTFLSKTNGAFFEPLGADLYTLENAIECSKILEYADGILNFCFVCEIDVVMNCNELDTGTYIYAADEGCPDEFIPLNTDFAGFLEMFLQCNTMFYWDFVNHGEMKYYDFRRPEDKL